MIPNNIRWDNVNIKMNKDSPGLKQIKYMKIRAFTMIFKKKEKKKQKLIGQYRKLRGPQVITLEVDQSKHHYSKHCAAFPVPIVFESQQGTGEGKVFFTEELQLMRAERMTEL